MSLVLVVHLTSQLLANSAIIPIGPQSEVLEPYQALQTQNPSWLTAEDVFKKLVGHPDPAQPSAQSLRALVNKAREKEAHFKSAQAAKLRKQVFESIARAPVLSRELVDLASETGHDQVAALLAQGQQAEAQKRATWLMAHYNSQPIDKLRHPPNVVKILSQAGQPKAQTKLTITTSRGGTLFADGQELGQIESTKTVSLPNPRPQKAK